MLGHEDQDRIGTPASRGACPKGESVARAVWGALRDKPNAAIQRGAQRGGAGPPCLPNLLIARIIEAGASGEGGRPPWKLLQWRRGCCC